MNIRTTVTVGSLLVALAGSSLALAQQTAPARPAQPGQPAQQDRPGMTDRERALQTQMRFDSFSSLKEQLFTTPGREHRFHRRPRRPASTARSTVSSSRPAPILGIGGKTVAVPYSQLTWNADDERFVLSTTADDLRRLPDFDPDTIGVAPIDRRMTTPPTGDSEGYATAPALASALRGAEIRCAADECGKVDDLIVEVRTGRVVFLSIDPNQNFLGIGDTKRLAPWPAARWNAAEEVVTLRATREQITSAPETPRDLSTIANAERVAAIYRGYGVEWSADHSKDASRDTPRPATAPGQRPGDRPGERPGERPTNPDRPGN